MMESGECAEDEKPPPVPTNRDRLPPVCGRLPKRNNIPYRSLGNGFINKVRDMWEIHDILTERQKAVVGGVGGSQGHGRDRQDSGVSLKTMTEEEGLALLNSGEREIGEIEALKMLIHM